MSAGIAGMVVLFALVKRKRLDLRSQVMPHENATRDSSHGAKFGERIDSIKDAIGRPEERASQATGYRTDFSGASITGKSGLPDLQKKARVLDRIESASPVMLGP